jgi:hypothetical protein
LTIQAPTRRRRIEDARALPARPSRARRWNASTAAKAALQQKGVEFVGETWDSGVCKGAAFKDPDGNGLALHRRYAPYPDGREP